MCTAHPHTALLLTAICRGDRAFLITTWVLSVLLVPFTLKKKGQRIISKCHPPPAVCPALPNGRRFLKDRFALSEPPSGTRLSVVAQEGCYHGDTLGAMNVAVPSVFNRGQHAW